MILARKTYYNFDEYPVKEDFKPNKITFKVIDGRKDKTAGCDYLNENRFYFYNNGGPMI